MIQFPTTFTEVQDAAELFLQHKAGKEVDCCQLGLACWNLCGYVKGQADTCQPKPNEAKSGVACSTDVTCEPCDTDVTCEPCSEEECCKHLKSLCEHQDSGKMAAPNIPWGPLLQGLIVVLQALAQQFGNQTTREGGPKKGKKSH